MANTATKKPRVPDGRYTTHYQLEHAPTTDILTRIKAATPKKEILLNVKITPAIAKDLLTVNSTNRHVRREDIKRWVKDMKGERWVYLGESLSFNKLGQMMNGQHRCIAIAESGMTQVYHIVTGLEPEAYDVMDTGRIRTASDTLSDLDFKNYNVMASAIKSEIYYRRYGKLGTNLNQQRVANYEVKDWVKNMVNVKLMNQCVEAACNGLWRKASFLSQSSWAFVYYVLSKLDKADAEHFIMAFASGENISMTKDPAIYLLREKLNAMALKSKKQGGYGSVTFVVKMHYIINAWNLFRDGKKPKELTIDVNAKEIPKAK